MSNTASSLKFLYATLRKRLPLFALIFALLFTVLAAAQYLFVRHGVYGAAEAQMKEWADQVAQEIGFKDRWNLTELRQTADIQAYSVFVFSSSGLIIQTTGFVRGFIGQTRLYDDSILDSPKSVTVTETGETWRMYARYVKGGVVVLGILDAHQLKTPDEVLLATANKFGASIEDAMKVRTGETPTEVDFAILSEAGQLLFSAEAVPLRTDLEPIRRLAKSPGPMQVGMKRYLTYSREILDSAGKSTGIIFLPKDVTGEENVIQKHIYFNAMTTAASWFVALLAVVTYLAIEDFRRRPKAISLEEALKVGETPDVEFKEGFSNIPLARAIAGFANTRSGTIFLGVDDSGNVVGVDCDSPAGRDQELKRIRNITTQSIKPAVPIDVDFLEHDGRTVVRIFVPRGPKALYFLEHEIFVREQTSSMKATPEQVEAIVSKFYK